MLAWKEKKRYVLILLVCVLFIGLLPNSVEAAGVVDDIQAVLPAGVPAIPVIDLVKYPCLVVQETGGTSYRISLWTSANYYRGTPFFGRTTYYLGTSTGDSEPDGIFYTWTDGSGTWEFFDKPDNLGIGYFSGSPEIYRPDNSVSRILYSTFTIYHYDGSVCHESDVQQAVPDTPDVVYPQAAEQPKFRRAPNGATNYYLQGVQADPLVVDAYVSDGGVLSYEWFAVYTGEIVGTGSTFIPPTDEAGEYHWQCKVTNKVYNPNVEGGYLYKYRFTNYDTVVVVPPDETVPPDVPGTPDYTDTLDGIQSGIDKLPDEFQGVIDKENEAAQQQGNDLVDQLTGIVPNDSAEFVAALRNLANVMVYDGTDAVLAVPEVKFPEIPGVIPEAVLLQQQEVDFEEYVKLMPGGLVILVQSLCTIALIVYCFKELYDLIAYLFTLKGGNSVE